MYSNMLERQEAIKKRIFVYDTSACVKTLLPLPQLPAFPVTFTIFTYYGYLEEAHLILSTLSRKTRDYSSSKHWMLLRNQIKFGTKGNALIERMFFSEMKLEV